jgi:hypothetical protein
MSFPNEEQMAGFEQQFVGEQLCSYDTQLLLLQNMQTAHRELLDGQEMVTRGFANLNDSQLKVISGTRLHRPVLAIAPPAGFSLSAATSPYRIGIQFRARQPDRYNADQYVFSHIAKVALKDGEAIVEPLGEFTDADAQFVKDLVDIIRMRKATDLPDLAANLAEITQTKQNLAKPEPTGEV